MTNLLESLHTSLGLSTEQICTALLRHKLSDSGSQAISPERVSRWLAGAEGLPGSVHRTAALIVIELWMEARDHCGPTELLAVDKKFTRLLREFSMAEIIALRNQLVSGSISRDTGAL